MKNNFHRQCRDGQGKLCPNPATHKLIDHEGKPVPGCAMCETHAQICLAEYSAKLGWWWSAEKLETY